MASMSPINTAVAASGASSNGGSVSPRQAVPPKNVSFQLVFYDSPHRRARLPMRVQIFPHDATDSIVSTVKNFYGLYSGPNGSQGVSFEDGQGNTLIARYENFYDTMTVFVRIIDESPVPPPSFGPHQYQTSPGADPAYYGGGDYHTESVQHYGQDIARPDSRLSLRRSPSPNASRGRRSDSASVNGKKARSRSAKNRGSSQADDAANGYSSGDGAPSSLSSKNKEHLGNTDISLENIVEGGRRKRAKFESSELPLFAPPQMPAATSNPSVSPARRIEHHRPSLPFVVPGQNPFTQPRPIQYPQYQNGLSHSAVYATPGSDSRRTRGSIGFAGNGVGGTGVLPTPDPTVGSCMSEEDKDVAIQLMRLGEMSNISHGRTSASTLDDTFSGKADAASSTGATSESEDESESEMPPARRQRLDDAGTAKQMYPTTTDAHFAPKRESLDVNGEDADYEDSVNGSSLADGQVRPVKAPTKDKVTSSMSKPGVPKAPKAPRSSNGTKTKKLPPVPAGPTGPTGPPMMPPAAKDAVATMGNMPPPDEEHPDLSSKPRCQRCRKSKKGCDRQRPCGRCRDAGLSADQCVSEDEGNGRKGRYGRHMGVPIKKDDAPIASQPTLLPAAPIATAAMTLDKSKKRKR